MNKDLSKQVSLQGPSITGTVTVSLIELDKLRLDHSNAVKYATELEAKQGKVKVTVVERRTSQDYMIDRYSGQGRWITDEKYIDVAVEYKGFDEFREIIRGEENQKVINEMRVLQDTIASRSQQLLKANQELIDLKEEIKKIKKTEVGELTTKNKALKDRVDFLEPYKEKFEKQVEVTNGINSRLKQVMIELADEKAKKGFWSFLK